MDYDLIIIGAGWAGLTAAKKAVKSGMKVCLIEKDKTGGVCLNRGCIPTKALIHWAKINSLNSKPVDFSLAQAKKNKIVSQLAAGVQFSLKGVDVLAATAKLTGPNKVLAGDKEISAKFILVSTGSLPFELPDLKFAAPKIISSDQLLQLEKLPPEILIVGAGVIGCEFASLFNQLGVKVTLAEKMPFILPGQDAQIQKKIETTFKKKGINVLIDADVKSMNLDGYSLIAVCVGRVANVSLQGAQEVGLKIQKQGFAVDEYLRTTVPNIFAAGDCTGKIMLAHYASYQAEVAVDNMLGANRKADNPYVPNCIFTDPLIASVGLTEEEAMKRAVDTVMHKFDFMASGMARVMDAAEGFIKIISDKASGKILGASMIGPEVTELISVITVAASNGLTVKQLKETIFAHPTLSESIREALE
ncbi:MAG: NAD(P)/FAD-dependent oxidoreductase [Candidatus Omnitrophica bacterium]|jgi:dihydrolipoamide dehydrogenase|nr:NAD(P)/FAD-dependent oxidoreductase [Candidatus Omnitrophota bacterium]